MSDTIRIQIWIDGEQVHDATLDGRNHQWLTEEHITMCADADKDGTPWLVEITDPDEETTGLPLRFGSDRHGMREPIRLDLSTLPKR